MIPVRVDAALSGVLAGRSGEAQVAPGPSAQTPAVLYELAGPIPVPVHVRVTLKSRAGIPLASSVVAVAAGDRAVAVPALTLLAMEGYAHLAQADREIIERRVWSRAAFVAFEEA
jgi:hypothetical protein